MLKNILVPVDVTHEKSCAKALAYGVDQTRHYGAQLHVLSVGDINLDMTTGLLPDDFKDKYRGQIEKRLTAVVKRYVPNDVPVRYIVREGRVYRQILEAAEQIGADLIIMASGRPAVREFLLGANAARVVRHAQCSVWVVRESD